jgi:hypothetical protein
VGYFSTFLACWFLSLQVGVVVISSKQQQQKPMVVQQSWAAFFSQLLLHCRELLYPGLAGQGLQLVAEDLLDELDASQASEQLLLTEE